MVDCGHKLGKMTLADIVHGFWDVLIFSLFWGRFGYQVEDLLEEKKRQRY